MCLEITRVPRWEHPNWACSRGSPRDRRTLSSWVSSTTPQAFICHLWEVSGHHMPGWGEKLAVCKRLAHGFYSFLCSQNRLMAGPLVLWFGTVVLPKPTTKSRRHILEWVRESGIVLLEKTHYSWPQTP